MAKDYVQAIVPEDGTVLDPFAGIGTVAQAAKETGRNSISIDLKDWSTTDG
jgi:DNA modification methylase